jgi:uncharacterized protein (TIGR02996 family)
VEDTFLHALHAEPNDEATWLALADWLEDDGQADRAEVVRLVRQLRRLSVMQRGRERVRLEWRLIQLLDAGVRPVVPELLNSIGMRLALILPGRFSMGSPANESGRRADEGPRHEVTITQPFYLGVFPVTQAQWQTVMGHNPSFFSAGGEGRDMVKKLDTGDFPLEQAEREEVFTFLTKLSRRKAERAARHKYRLPTEAEWEYACRGGVMTSAFHYGNSLCSTQANFSGREPYGKAGEGPNLRRTCAVGSYRPNAFGLYDMHGNVYERCSDWYADDYYASSPAEDPEGASTGPALVVRGGCWSNDARLCRSARRCGDATSGWMGGLGFRVVLALFGQ